LWFGYFPSPNEPEVTVPRAHVLGTKALAATALAAGVDKIVVALTEHRGGSMSLHDFLDCKIQGIRVSDISTHFEKTLGQIHLGYVNAGWLIFGNGLVRVGSGPVSRAFSTWSVRRCSRSPQLPRWH
jgi:hypothetical protein